MKLIPMTDFVLEQIENMKSEFKKGHDANFARLNVVDNVEAYANFLKQPLALWMFVPCDENGNILSEPNAEDYFNTNIPIDQYTDEDKDGINKHYFALMSYEDSKERCLFEGFEVHEVFTGVNEKTKTISLGGLINVFWIDAVTQTWNPSMGLRNIEGLVNYGLTLTETALKTL